MLEVALTYTDSMYIWALLSHSLVGVWRYLKMGVIGALSFYALLTDV